jgi:NADH-quinone oxidoreductase subunit H
MLLKMLGFFLFTQWARSAVPGLRVDQFLGLGWKGMPVLSFANLVLTAVVVGLVAA